MHEANRLKRLPPYLFTVVDNLRVGMQKKGVDVIDLSMGSPDLPAPQHAIDALCAAARKKGYHRYSRKDGEVEKELRKAIADWYMRKFDVALDPETEVLPLIGSKEGIAHLSLGFLNHDDIAIVPSPAYPVHFNGVIMAGGLLHTVPLTPENNYQIDFRTIEPKVLKSSKLIIISYPNNPTTQVVDLGYFQEVADWARGRDIIIAHDLAYSDIVFDGYIAPSFLQARGAKDVGIEFHTISKSYNMAGWRLAFCVGNSGILSVLAKTKSYIDFGLFRAIQEAATVVLNGPQDIVAPTVEEYKKRRDFMIEGLNRIGWPVDLPKATFYIWARIPAKFNTFTSLEFAKLLIEEAGVAVSPGTGFGEAGEGFVRFALVDEMPRLGQALERIKAFIEQDM